MATIEKTVDLMQSIEMVQDLHYTDINADFKTANLGAAVIAKLYSKDANIEGEKLSAQYLSAKDLDNENAPKNPADLIKFSFQDNSVAVPVKMFSEQAIETLNLDKMTKGDINEHYDNRKENIVLQSFTREELENTFDKTVERMMDNPLMQGDLAVDALQDINPKMLEYNNKTKNHTNITKDGLQEKMTDKVFQAFDEQQEKALNNIVPTGALLNGRVAIESGLELGA